MISLPAAREAATAASTTERAQPRLRAAGRVATSSTWAASPPSRQQVAAGSLGRGEEPAVAAGRGQPPRPLEQLLHRLLAALGRRRELFADQLAAQPGAGGEPDLGDGAGGAAGSPPSQTM